jgi:hypothetical protein
MKLLKKDKFGEKYQIKNFKIYYKNKNSISGDNSINPKEKIVLIKGKIEITIKNEISSVESPCEFIIPEKTYHKIVAQSDCIFLIFEEK